MADEVFSYVQRGFVVVLVAFGVSTAVGEMT